jgi:GT2 family glycosyltransferase
VLLSYCVVNTDGREDLLACLDAIERTAPEGVERQVLVLDNASTDGSADAVRARHPDARLIELERREGKAANDSRLLQSAQGEFCLLLNEDSELQPGSVAALLDAVQSAPDVAVAGAQLLTSEGVPVPCAWRFPGTATALAGAAFLHQRFTVQSGGDRTRQVDWVQSSAMLVRREAAQGVGYLDPAFFIYSDETDFCRRLAAAGWRTLYVPAARAIHHDQMASDLAGAKRRTVEFHRNRDRYLRKHSGRVTAGLLRPLLAFPYLVRTVAALFTPGRDPKRMWFHARQALSPGGGQGISEAADAFNRRLESPDPAS